MPSNPLVMWPRPVAPSRSPASTPPASAASHITEPGTEAGQPEDRGRQARISTTRRSTGRMRSWPRTTARWSTRRGRSSRRTSRRWNARCPMFGTRSGGAGSSPRWRRCAPPRWSGASRSPGRGRVARWTAPPRPRCSTPSSGDALAPLPTAPFVLATWSSARVGPDIHANVGGHALLGAVAAHRGPARRPLHGDDGAAVPPRAAGQDPPAQGPRQADRPGRLPAGEDRLPHAHPDLVPPPGRRDRPGRRRR